MSETVQKRSLAAIQEDIVKHLRTNQGYEKERNQRLRKLLIDIDARKAALDEAQRVLLIAQARDPATQMLAMNNERLEKLKAEALASFHVSEPRTWKTFDGGGFQFRTKTITRIADQPGLAVWLAEGNCWDEAGAELTVDPKRISSLLEKYTIPGVGLDIDVTVALFQPKEI